MSNVINFNTREGMEIAGAKGRIERQVAITDAAIQQLLETVLDEAEILAEEEIMDIHEMVEAISAYYKAMLRDPREYDSFLIVQDWANTLDTLTEMEADDE